MRFALRRLMIQDTFTYRLNLALEYPGGLTNVCGLWLS